MLNACGRWNGMAEKGVFYIIQFTGIFNFAGLTGDGKTKLLLRNFTPHRLLNNLLNMNE